MTTERSDLAGRPRASDYTAHSSDRGSAAPSVSILIVSIGRPELVRTIASARVAAQATGLPHEIVLVDDSEDARTVPLVAQGEDFDIVFVHSAARNIARARNASFAAARGALLACLDDDEWAEPDWLVRHIEALEEFGADASIGPVRAHYPEGAPKWVMAGDPYSRWWLSRGQRLVRGTTANAVLRAETVRRLGLQFDEAFGRSGGEDADMFQRLSSAGGVIVAGGGVVHEEVSIDRCSARNLWLRALRVGQTFARSNVQGSSPAQRAFEFVSTAFKVAVLAGASFVLLPFGMRYALPRALDAVRNAGKLREMLGIDLVVYYPPSR